MDEERDGKKAATKKMGTKQAGTVAGNCPREEAPRLIRNRNRRVQYAPTSRRLFNGARKAVFLEWFAGTANLSFSARKAGVHYRTVLRHRAEDPAFAEALDRALDQSDFRLGAWLKQAKAEKAGRRIEFDPSGPGGGGGEDGAEEEEEEVGGDPAPENLTPDQAMELLRNQAQRRE